MNDSLFGIMVGLRIGLRFPLCVLEFAGPQAGRGSSQTCPMIRLTHSTCKKPLPLDTLSQWPEIDPRNLFLLILLLLWFWTNASGGFEPGKPWPKGTILPLQTPPLWQLQTCANSPRDGQSLVTAIVSSKKPVHCAELQHGRDFALRNPADLN